MARNIEIKARVASLEAVAQRLDGLEVSEVRRLRQEDVFFAVPRGRLKLRSFDEGDPELIYYERADRSGPGLSVYYRASCTDAQAMTRVLSAAFGVRGVVRKQRTAALVGPTRVHLDHVDGLGTFVELEVVLDENRTAADGRAEAERLMTALGIAADDLVEVAYVDLLPDASDG